MYKRLHTKVIFTWGIEHVTWMYRWTHFPQKVPFLFSLVSARLVRSGPTWVWWHLWSLKSDWLKLQSCHTAAAVISVDKNKHFSVCLCLCSDYWTTGFWCDQTSRLRESLQGYPHWIIFAQLLYFQCFLQKSRVNEQQNYNYVTPKITITAINYIFWFILLVLYSHRFVFIMVLF